MLFFTGLASTPNSVGLKCLTTGETIHEIEVAMPSGKDTRNKYNKVVNLLKQKYAPILN
jgi:hypothetical protein